MQKAAKKRREAQLRDWGQRRMAQMERQSLDQLRREVSRTRWQAKTGANVEADAYPHKGRAPKAEPSRTSGASAESVTNALDRLLAKVNNPASG